MKLESNKTSKKRSSSRSAVELLSSMRFAIALLVVLALASVIGTVLKQQEPYSNYVAQFGPFWAEIFHALGIYSVYSSWWFIAILLFLVVSLSLCLWRNGPSMIAEMRNWKDRVHENNLRAFGHRADFKTAYTRTETAERLRALLKAQGYRYKIKSKDAGLLIAAKRGTLSKLGYIFAHLAIVVICLGGLLDSNVPVRLQMWLFDKTPLQGNAVLAEIAPKHRLSVSNPTFRGQTWVAEGQHVSTTILNQGDGVLIQDLPFTIQLNQFSVEYYSTGMPKRFVSDIVVLDHLSQQRIKTQIEVNKPFIHRGIAVYQSSFEDGGSRMQFTAYPMTGSAARSFPLKGQINQSLPLASGDATIEWTDFRAINVENISDANGKTDVRGVTRRPLKEVFAERLGSGAKTSKPQTLRNIGPSVHYKIRDAAGQAREFSHYMLPVEIDGEWMFLAGMRESPQQPFRYLRIPADAEHTVKTWIQLRAALQNPLLRTAAAKRFALRLAKPGTPLQAQLEQSATHVLELFAGNHTPVQVAPNGAPDSLGGFAALANFIEFSVPKAEQAKAVELLLRTLEGVVWDLWQIVRERSGLAPNVESEVNGRFVQSSINALSDSFLYHAPLLLQLDSFDEVKASVFQVTRAPGKKIVYFGSLLLVLGVFAMFYLRERRVWFWLKESENSAATDVLMAMSAARRTLDFENEFVQLRYQVGITLNHITDTL